MFKKNLFNSCNKPVNKVGVDREAKCLSLFQQYAWTERFTSMCSTRKATVTVKRTMCIWTFAMMMITKISSKCHLLVQNYDFV